MYGKTLKANLISTCTAIESLLVAVITMWLSRLLVHLGDAQSNPGPVSTSSAFLSIDSSFSSSFCILDFIRLSCHLSFVQYNVQSVLTK